MVQLRVIHIQCESRYSYYKSARIRGNINEELPGEGLCKAAITIYGNCVLKRSKNSVKSSFFLMCEGDGYGMIALVISVKARRLSDVLCKKST